MVVRLECVSRTRPHALVVVQDQVVIASYAAVWPAFAAGAIGLTRYANLLVQI